MVVFLEKFYLWLIKAGMPVVYGYLFICGSIFLNTAAEEATGWERAGNQLLAPFQYLFAGKVAKADSYELEQRFAYNEHFAVKTVGSALALPLSLPLGSLVKGASYLFLETRERHRKIDAVRQATATLPNTAYYASVGISLSSPEEREALAPPLYQRRPGDEETLLAEKAALKEVVRLLNENQIPYWADCGTLLGAYRYGGAIPWDNDIDIAVLAPDFRNVLCALNALDPKKYRVCDWSGRTRPGSFVVVCIKETGGRIDIGHFAINPEKREVTLILSNEESIFLPEIWKRVERLFVVPTPYEVIFPLKVAQFDGIALSVPNQVETYLRARYGEDLRPAKLYDAVTKRYERDPSHPYWALF